MADLKNCICRQVPWGDGTGKSGECVRDCPYESTSKGKRNTCAPNEDSKWILYADFESDNRHECKTCTAGDANTAPGLCSKDCLPEVTTEGRLKPEGIASDLDEFIRKQHNIINNIACELFNTSNELGNAKGLINTGVENINWAKKTTTTAKNIKNVQLLDKQNSLYTKKRLLLYDEKNDRIYRVVILILKTFLLIISLIVIKFLLND
jgi:hypothetical protein